jgi:hypothetical protein
MMEKFIYDDMNIFGKKTDFIEIIGDRFYFDLTPFVLLPFLGKKMIQTTS